MAAPAQSKRITIISASSLHSPSAAKTKSKNEENHQNSPFLPKFCGLHRGSERHNTIATSPVDLPLAPKISARYPAYLSCWSQNLFFHLERLAKIGFTFEPNSFSFRWSRISRTCIGVSEFRGSSLFNFGHCVLRDQRCHEAQLGASAGPASGPLLHLTPARQLASSSLNRTANTRTTGSTFGPKIWVGSACFSTLSWLREDNVESRLI